MLCAALLITAPLHAKSFWGGPGPSRMELLQGEKLEPYNRSLWRDVNDYEWFISIYSGAIKDGHDNCFDDSDYPIIDNSPFSADSSSVADGRALYSDLRHRLRLRRLVRLNHQRSAMRYIDVYTNLANQPRTLSLHWKMRLEAPPAQVVTSTGRDFRHGGAFRRGELGFVMRHAANKDEPSAMFVLLDDGAKLRPTVVAHSRREFRVKCELTLEPKQTRAFVHFVVQRPREALAADKLDEAFGEFYTHGLKHAKLPDVLRGKVVNFGRIGSQFKHEPLLRPLKPLVQRAAAHKRQTTTLVLGARNRLRGQLTGGTFTIETRFGATRIPAKAMMGLIGGNDAGRPQRLLLRDGSVLTGDIHATDVRLNTQRGAKLRVRPAGLDVLVGAARAGDARPSTEAMTCMRTRHGETLMLARSKQTVRLITPWGALHVPWRDVYRIERNQQKWGLPRYRVTLTGGDEFDALIADESLSFNALRLGAIGLAPSEIASVTRLRPAHAPVPGAQPATESNQQHATHQFGTNAQLTGRVRRAGRAHILRTAYGTLHIPARDWGASSDKDTEDTETDNTDADD